MGMWNDTCQCIDENWKALKARIQASITGITVNGVTHYQTDGTGICDLGEIEGTTDANEIFLKDGRSVETAIVTIDTALPGKVIDVEPSAVTGGINLNETDGNGTTARMLIRADDSLTFNGLQIGISDKTDTRITEALNTATTAGNKADDAQADADSAMTAATTANGTANTALTKAETAITNAATAQATAITAQGTAETAISDAETAQTTATTAKTTAEGALSTANTAIDTANTAQETADTANAVATTAQATASTAKTTADSALSTASTANDTAKKAQDTAETANATATDAQATASTAKTTADTAKTTAETAQADATDALTKANASIKGLSPTIFIEPDNYTGFIITSAKNDGTNDIMELFSIDAADFVSPPNVVDTYPKLQLNTDLKAKINNAVKNAETAQTTASTAKTTAEGALSTANTAIDTANTAQADATQAKSDASDAVSTANTANSTASSAYQTAVTAKTTAENAGATANTANTNANSALTKAKNAIVSFVTAVADKVLNATVTKGDGTTETVPLFTAGNNLSWNGKTLNAVGGAAYSAGDGMTLADGAFSVNAGTGLQINATDKSLEVDSSTTDALDSRVTNLETTASGLQTSVSALDTSVQTLDGEVDTLNTTVAGKQATITGGASTITTSNLTASRALISNASGKVVVSDVTSTELGYLDGVTKNIQTQFALLTGFATVPGVTTGYTPADTAGTSYAAIVQSNSLGNGFTSIAYKGAPYEYTIQKTSNPTSNVTVLPTGLKIAYGSCYGYTSSTRYAPVTVNIPSNLGFFNTNAYSVIATIDDTSNENLWGYLTRVKKNSGISFTIYVQNTASSGAQISKDCVINWIAIGY